MANNVMLNYYHYILDIKYNILKMFKEITEILETFKKIPEIKMPEVLD